jgi:hypothetical protein
MPLVAVEGAEKAAVIALVVGWALQLSSPLLHSVCV